MEILILTLFPFMLFSQTIEKDIDSLFSQTFKNNQAGGALLIVKNNKKVYEKAIGMTDDNTHTALTPLSNFRMASVSKQFTAAAILLLEKRGKLSLENPISQYFPSFSKVGTTVKIKHLLNHSSGLIDYESLMSDTITHQLTDKEVLEIIQHQDTTYFKTGEGFRYSNGAYCLMALIVEKVSGLGFPDFLSKNIFQPLGMMNSQVFDNQHVIKNRVYGFAKNKNGELTPRDQSTTSATMGDGGVYTSLHDYYLWHKMLFKPQFLNLEQVLKINKNLLPNKKGFYNAGWFFNTDNEGNVVEIFHSGSTCGFSNIVIGVPKKGILIAFFSNIADNHGSFKPIYEYLKSKKWIESDIWSWHEATN